jgi:thiol-disulfide isomerase/thioredoxin
LIICIALFIALEPVYAVAKCPKAFNGFTFYDLKGMPAKISCSQYKVLIVNFWATWCAPCMAEIPLLNDISMELKSQGVEVVGVSLDTMKPQRLSEFVKSLKISYPVFLGNALELRSNLSVIAVPAIFIINRDGEIFRTLVGYHSKDEILAVIKNIL